MKYADNARLSIPAVALLAVLLGLSPAAQGPQKAADIIIGHTVSFHSKIFDIDIALSVYLPPGYGTGAAKYPVIYDLNAPTTFAHDAGTVDYLSRQGSLCIPEMIVVGVPFLPADYVPLPFAERREDPRAADQVLRFFREELKPFIEGEYRTSGYDILTGHSVAGLLTTYALFTQPDLFSAGIASSPWFEARDQYWLKQIDKMFQAGSLTGKSLFMTVGKREEALTISTFTELEKWMGSKDLKGLTWKTAWLDGLDHLSMIGRSFYDGLLFIFDGWPFPYDLLASADVPGINAYIAKMRARFDGRIDYRIPEDLLDTAASDLYFDKSYDRAGALYALAAELYPDAWMTYFRIAEISAIKGDKVQAEKNYGLSVQKNPGRTDREKILLQVAGAKFKPTPVPADKLKMYAGDYGAGRVFLENGGLTYQKSGGPKLRLAPITAALFAVEGYDVYWIEFAVTDGKVTALAGLFADGTREFFPRTR
jgi:predicted alpha/beta superfamily hydrolase